MAPVEPGEPEVSKDQSTLSVPGKSCEPGIDLGEAGILDAEFFAKEFDLLLELVVLGRQADSGVEAVGRPAAGYYDSVMGQGDDVQNSGLDVLGPAGGHRNVLQ